jgi:hypothetical protein
MVNTGTMGLTKRSPGLRFWCASAALTIWVLFVYHRAYDIDPLRQKLVCIAAGGLVAILSMIRDPGPNAQRALFYGWLSLVTCAAGLVVCIHPLATLSVCGLLATAWVVGRVVVNWARISTESRLTYAVHALATGLAFCSVGVLILGLVGSLHAAVLWVLMALAVVWEWRRMRILALWRVATECSRKFGAAGWLMVAIITVFAGIFLVRSLAPPVGGDDLTYHLALPRIFAQAGRVFSVPYFTHFDSPLGAEMLYTAGMVLGSEYAACGLINLVYAVALLAAFVVLGRRVGGGLMGLMAWIAVFSVYFYTLMTCSGNDDLKFLLYVFLAIDAFLGWTETRKERTILLCAAEVGCSLHFRYHGVILFAIILAGVLWVIWTSPRVRGGFFTCLRFTGTAAVIGCPWLVRNWLETGNPIFPTSTRFFNGYLGDPEMSEMWREYGNPGSPWLFGAYGFGTGWYNYFSLPWRLTFLAGGFEGYENTPVYLAFSPLVLWGAWRSKAIRLLALFALAYATAWFFQMHQLKFLIPAFGAWALAAGAAAILWSRESGRFGRALILGLFVAPVVCTLSISWIYVRQDLADAAKVALRPAERDNYLMRHLPNYAMMRYINEHVAGDAVVFSMSEQSLFYLKKSYVLGIGHTQLYVDYRTMPAFRDLLARLKGLKVTHLLFRPGQVPTADHLVGAPVAALTLMLRKVDYSYLTHIYQDDGLALFQIKYPSDLLPYDPSKHADRVALGDVLLGYGMLDRARDQYAKAGPAGDKKRRALDEMDHQARGDFYLAKARTLDRAFFLKPALDEFAAAAATARNEEARSLAERSCADVHTAGLRLAPYVWNRLPDSTWLVSGHGLP